MLKKINHIAIAVNNIEEAAKFYQDVLGLNLSGVELVSPILNWSSLRSQIPLS